MTPGFVIAILLCLGDSCDLVRPEPDVTYPTYEACSAATAKKQAKIAETAAQYREQGRQEEIICLRDLTQIATPGSMESRQQSQATNAPKRPTSPPEVAGPTAAAPLAPPPQAGAPASRSREFRDCEQCPVMVALPGGTFEMGSNADPSERPVHAVSVAALAIGKYEVSQGEWAACAATGGCAYKPKEGSGPAQFPMTNLAWDDAAGYTRWLSRVTGKSYRLPTEAEWEYAARAGTTTRYYWGNEIGVGKADCKGCGGPYDPRAPSTIGSFAANPWGLFDMLGGVAEWTEDCWHKNYNGAPSNGAAWRANPCPTRVLRGGSWKNPPDDLTVSNRNYYDASVRYVANGMRVALSLK